MVGLGALQASLGFDLFHPQSVALLHEKPAAPYHDNTENRSPDEDGESSGGLSEHCDDGDEKGEPGRDDPIGKALVAHDESVAEGASGRSAQRHGRAGGCDDEAFAQEGVVELDTNDCVSSPSHGFIHHGSLGGSPVLEQRAGECIFAGR